MSTKLLALLGGGGFGLLFVAAGLLIALVQHRRQKRMTARVTGRVCRYSYRGEGNIAPVMSYEVDGKTYEVRRKFRGIVEKSVTSPIPTIRDSGAYVTDKDVLVLHTGNINNYKAMLEALWPIGQPAVIFYNPEKPKQARAEKLLHLPGVLTVVYFWVGIGIMLLGVLLSFLLPEA